MGNSYIEYKLQEELNAALAKSKFDFQMPKTIFDKGYIVKDLILSNITYDKDFHMLKSVVSANMVDIKDINFLAERISDGKVAESFTILSEDFEKFIEDKKL